MRAWKKGPGSIVPLTKLGSLRKTTASTPQEYVREGPLRLFHEVLGRSFTYTLGVHVVRTLQRSVGWRIEISWLANVELWAGKLSPHSLQDRLSGNLLWSSEVDGFVGWCHVHLTGLSGGLLYPTWSLFGAQLTESLLRPPNPHESF